ncbi:MULTISPECIES: formylglycine-generating enzyme family protein [Sorangium]|uniref:formylglycine-generating enzyme family protein n=1 Tax=Sorangium TaxID=39643 RepID=UPI003D9C073A
MARVPGGSFVMGPLKVKATVGDLCMDRTEVTAASYAACVTAGQCTDTLANCAKEASTYGVAGKEEQPMVCVDFAQTQAYCAAQGKRLPRDDEWEWAARGGEEARPYPWGGEAPKDQLCWSGGGAVRKTACDVGSFPAGANPQGIQDLAGNVFEWTTSANDGGGKMRVARGGSWRDGIPPLVRTARPGGYEVTYRLRVPRDPLRHGARGAGGRVGRERWSTCPGRPARGAQRDVASGSESQAASASAEDESTTSPTRSSRSRSSRSASAAVSASVRGRPSRIAHSRAVI